VPVTMVLIGTRKGCFVLESDGDRRDWKVRGPYCEGWPVYHAVYDSDTGAPIERLTTRMLYASLWLST